jgi:hypothetical protein
MAFINNIEKFIQPLNFNCNDTFDLFNEEGGKLIICTHDYGTFDALNFLNFLSNNINSESNVKWTFVAGLPVIRDSFYTYIEKKLGIDIKKVYDIGDEETHFYKVFHFLLKKNKYSNKLFDKISKITILNNRKIRIMSELKSGKNVVLFNNGDKFSKKLYSLLNESHLNQIFFINMKLNDDYLHEKISSSMFNKKLRWFGIAKYINYSLQKNSFINIEVTQKKFTTIPLDFSEFKHISSEIYNNDYDTAKDFKPST